MDLEKIAAAKLWLVSPPPTSGATSADSPRDLPYLAHALYALIPVACEDVPRMTCDEWWRVYVNDGWLDNATVPEVGQELAHLVWHLLADHTGRARSQGVDRATATSWGTAADATIAHTLAPDALKPEDLPTAIGLGLKDGHAAEEYYAQLSNLPVTQNDSVAGGQLEAQDGCGSGSDGMSRSNEFGPETDIGAVARFEADEIRRKVVIEYQRRRGRRGNSPGEAERWVKHILQPEVPWEPLLSGAVRRAVGWAAGRGDFTYTRPSRRASALPGIVLPGQHRPVPKVSIIIDTSASVDDVLLARALGEVDGALQALGVAGANLTIYSVDAAVHSVQNVRRASDVKLVGAGGTDMRVGFGAIDDERPRPDVVICLTDGDTPWPSAPPPGAAVIIALLGRSDRDFRTPTPAWATRIECVLEGRAAW